MNVADDNIFCRLQNLCALQTFVHEYAYRTQAHGTRLAGTISVHFQQISENVTEILVKDNVARYMRTLVCISISKIVIRKSHLFLFVLSSTVFKQTFFREKQNVFSRIFTQNFYFSSTPIKYRGKGDIS